MSYLMKWNKTNTMEYFLGMSHIKYVIYIKYNILLPMTHAFSQEMKGFQEEMPWEQCAGKWWIVLMFIKNFF